MKQANGASTHYQLAVFGCNVFVGDTGNKDFTRSYAFLYFTEESLAATHIVDVHPAAVAETSQLAVQRFDQLLVVPLIGYEDL